MRVVKYVDGGIVRRVVLFDDAGVEVVLVTRFLAHLADSGFSPNTLCAFGYDQVGDDGKSRWTVGQVAAEFGVTRPTIYRYLDQAPSANSS